MPPIPGTGEQHGEHLVLVLAPKRTRIEGQQAPIAALEKNILAHVASPPEKSSRDEAATTFARSRPASVANRSRPEDVSR